jgi:hypothetical protein
VALAITHEFVQECTIPTALTIMRDGSLEVHCAVFPKDGDYELLHHGVSAESERGQANAWCV